MQLMQRKELAEFRKHASNAALWEKVNQLTDHINRATSERGALLAELQKRTYAIPGQEKLEGMGE